MQITFKRSATPCKNNSARQLWEKIKTTSWHLTQGTLLRLFIPDPLTEAVFPPFASCDICGRACPAQNRTPAPLSPHQVSRTQNTAGGPGPEASPVQRSCARETECGLGRSSLRHWPAVTASPWEPVCSFQTGDLLAHKVQSPPET